MRLSESSLLDKWREKYWPKEKDCHKKLLSATPSSINIQTLSGLFYLTAGLLLVSAIIFYVEIKNCKNEKRHL